jgi:phage terminase large subunit
MPRDLHVKPHRWARPLINDEARYLCAHSGRSSGKSHFFAELLVVKHVDDVHRSTVVIREVQHTLRNSVKALIQEKIRALGVEDYFVIQDSQILSKFGTGKIAFVGMQSNNADNLKSLEGFDCAWVEEAQTLSQRSFDILRPTIRKDRSQLWFSWNPDDPEGPVDDFFRCNGAESKRKGLKPPANAVVIETDYTLNPDLSEAAKQEAETAKVRRPETFGHIWKGEYESFSEARVFTDWSISPAPLTPPEHAVLRFGADWGFSPDPTVLVRGWLLGETLFIDQEAYATEVPMLRLPSLFATVDESAKHKIICDNTEPRTIHHMRTNGFPLIQPAVKGKDSVDEGVKYLQGLTIVIDAECKNTMREIKNYKRKIDPDTGKVTSELADKDNHVIDSIRYMLEPVMRGVREAQKAPPAPNAPAKNYWGAQRR